MIVVPEEVRKHTWMQYGIIGACITGSTLVRDYEYSDIDYCILFKDYDKMTDFVYGVGGTINDYDQAGDFVTCRRGPYNFICTDSEELYWRTVAFSGALELLQLKDKYDRVQLAKACMDWEPKL